MPIEENLWTIISAKTAGNKKEELWLSSIKNAYEHLDNGRREKVK